MQTNWFHIPTDSSSLAYSNLHGNVDRPTEFSESTPLDCDKLIIVRDVERRTRTLTNDRTIPKRQSKSLTRKSDRLYDGTTGPGYNVQSGNSGFPVRDCSVERPGSVMTEEIVSAFSPPLRRSRSLPRSAQSMQKQRPEYRDTESSHGTPLKYAPYGIPMKGKIVSLMFCCCCLFSSLGTSWAYSWLRVISSPTSLHLSPVILHILIESCE